MPSLEQVKRYETQKKAFIEFCRQSKENDQSRDVEDDHRRMDQFILEMLDDEDITDAFNSVSKWYA